jgi:hypothetical protein
MDRHLLPLLLSHLPVLIVMMGVSLWIVMLEAFRCDVSIHTAILGPSFMCGFSLLFYDKGDGAHIKIS